MTTPLDTIRYHSGIAGEEVADMVDSLEQEVSTLREQVERLKALVVMRCDLDVPPQFSQGLQSHEVLEPVTAEHCQWFVAEIEKLRKERDELHRAFNQPVPRSEWEKMQEQLAALAEQNAKLRDALGWHPGNYKLNDEDRKHINEALSIPALAYQNAKMREALLLARFDSLNMTLAEWGKLKEAAELPDPASPVLNRIKAEGMRDAAMHCSKHGSRTADEVSEDLFANADELEQSK